MEVTTKEYKGSKTIHRVADFDGGYDPINGFYLSSQMFDASTCAQGVASEGDKKASLLPYDKKVALLP